MIKKKFIFIVLALLVLAGYFVISGNKITGEFTAIDSAEKIVVYKSSSCGCCGIYFDYFKREGNKNVKMVETSDRSLLKQEYEIPSFLESCHTTIIGDYFIEGHVPLEAIDELLSEKPDIAGIGIPGMPSGTPGMPGQKTEDWIIYGIKHDGSSFEFMVI